MQRIIVIPNDQDSARRAAVDLLAVAVAGDGPESIIRYRAAWLGAGSPAALAALELHRNAQVTSWDLATALGGRAGGSGEEIRRPGMGVVEPSDKRWHPVPEGTREYRPIHASPMFTFSAPGSLAREFLYADRERQAEIERAMFKGAEAALEYMRQSRPLVERRSDGSLVGAASFVAEGEFAHSLAAVAFVEVPDEREPDRPLSVHVVVVGAETPERFVAPETQALLASESEANAVAAKAIAAAQEPAARERSSARVVGREDAWVPDPLDARRGVLGQHAERVDDLAALYGEQYVHRDDEWLARELERVEAELEPLDGDRAAAATDVADQREAAQERLLRSQEDAIALGAWGYAHAVTVLRAHEQQLRGELEEANRDLSAAYLDAWVNEHGAKLAQWVALARERTIRAQEHGRELTGGGAATGSRERPPNGRLTGRGDVADVLTGLRAERNEWREESGATVRIDRSAVSAQNPLELLRHVAGAEQTERLAKQMDALGDWLAGQSDEWVEKRYAELGPPDSGLDRAGALEYLRIEVSRRALDKEARSIADTLPLDGVHVNHVVNDQGLLEYEAIDPRFDVPCRQVNWNLQKLRQLREIEAELHAEGRHPGRWRADDDRVARSLAYAQEIAIRRERNLLQAVERSVVEPPDHIVELVGDVPAAEGPERHEWEAVVRAHEHERLTAQMAPDNDARRIHGWRAEQAARELDERVDRLREARGMPPLTHETAINAPELGR